MRGCSAVSCGPRRSSPSSRRRSTRARGRRGWKRAPGRRGLPRGRAARRGGGARAAREDPLRRRARSRRSRSSRTSSAAAASRGLVFKATAGLHHAYPTEDGEHGFLNVLAASVFGDEEEALRERSPRLRARRRRRSAGATRKRFPPSSPTSARRSSTRSGRCSFFEPVGSSRSWGSCELRGGAERTALARRRRGGRPLGPG